VIMPTEREITAYHEAGHAVVGYHLGVRLSRVSIIPDADSLGRVTREFLDLSCSEAVLESVLAGPMAQDRLVGHRDGGQDDYIRARGLCQFVTGSAGARARAFLRDMEEQAARSVDRWWPEIEAVALALLDCPELDEDEFRYLLVRLDGPTRAERIEMLQDEDEWVDDSPIDEWVDDSPIDEWADDSPI
jgi:peptidase M41-like protein